MKVFMKFRKHQCILLLAITFVIGCGRQNSSIPTNGQSKATDRDQAGNGQSLQLMSVQCKSYNFRVSIPNDFVVNSDTKRLFSAVPQGQSCSRDMFPISLWFFDHYPKEQYPKPEARDDQLKETVVGDLKITSQIVGTPSVFVRVHTCIVEIRDDLWAVAKLSSNFTNKRFDPEDLATIILSIRDEKSTE